MYWTERVLGTIQRANLDGSDIEDVTDGGGAPYEVTLDVPSGKMYWTDLDAGNPARQPRRHRRGACWWPWGSPIRAASRWMAAAARSTPWTHTRAKRSRTRFGASTSTAPVARCSPCSDMHGAVAIALDVAGGKMYWTDPNRDDPKEEAKIQRANLDGSGVRKTLLTGADGLVSPQGIAVDGAARRLYWTDQGSGPDPGPPTWTAATCSELVTAGRWLGKSAGHRRRRRQDLLDRSARRQDPAPPTWTASDVRDLVTDGTGPIHRSLALDAEAMASCTGPTGAPTRSSAPTWTAPRSRTW